MVSAKLTSGTKKLLHGVAHRQKPLSSHYLVAGELLLEARDLAAELLNPGSHSFRPLQDADGGLGVARPGRDMLLFFESRKRRKWRSIVGNDEIVQVLEHLSYFVYIKVGAHAEWAQGNTRKQTRKLEARINKNRSSIPMS